MPSSLVGATAALVSSDNEGPAIAGTIVMAQPVATAPAAADASPDQLFAIECGACHMAYPPGLLPARSWTAIMETLASHFGEDASLDAASAQAIGDYLLANAADAGGNGGGVLRGLAKSDTPLRITDLPFWIRAHNEVSAAAFKRANVKSKSNCVACHGQGAASGIFGDD